MLGDLLQILPSLLTMNNTYHVPSIASLLDIVVKVGIVSEGMEEQLCFQESQANIIKTVSGLNDEGRDICDPDTRCVQLNENINYNIQVYISWKTAGQNLQSIRSCQQWLWLQVLPSSGRPLHMAGTYCWYRPCYISSKVCKNM